MGIAHSVGRATWPPIPPCYNQIGTIDHSLVACLKYTNMVLR